MLGLAVPSHIRRRRRLDTASTIPLRGILHSTSTARQDRRLLCPLRREHHPARLLEARLGRRLLEHQSLPLVRHTRLMVRRCIRLPMETMPRVHTLRRHPRLMRPRARAIPSLLRVLQTNLPSSLTRDMERSTDGSEGLPRNSGRLLRPQILRPPEDRAQIRSTDMPISRATLRQARIRARTITPRRRLPAHMPRTPITRPLRLAPHRINLPISKGPKALRRR